MPKPRLDTVRDVPEEAAGDPAVADTVVEGEGQLCDHPGHDQAVDDPGAGDDPAEPENRGLGVVDDRRRSVDAEDAVVVDGERAAGQPLRRQRTGPGLFGTLGKISGKLLERACLRVRDDRDDQSS